MFYSHEILTDRKHGVATIWLVATLGSKSALKKVTRKAIMEVNVPDACGTITDPSAPLALRLQGNLLFGVSRVFSQQCAYVLTDMQSLRDKMRGISVLLKELETDPDVATTRPEQLNLQVDPSFNIDLDLGFDLSSFDVSFASSEPSNVLSPRTLASSQTSFLDEEQMLGLGSPLASASHGAETGLGLSTAQPASDAVGEQSTSHSVNEPAIAARPSVVEEAAFDIDEEGNMVFREEWDQPPPVEQSDIDVLMADNWNGFELNLDAEQAQAREVQSPQPVLDDHVYVGGEDGPQVDQDPTPQAPAARSSPSVQPPRQSIEDEGRAGQDGEEIELATRAAQQRTTKTKTKTTLVPMDNPAELQNRVLGEWNGHYLEFMEEAHVENAGKISLAQAKRNAAYWVLDQGVGGVHADFGDDQDEHPLALFSGQALLHALLGPQAQAKSRKRTRSPSGEDEDDSTESRRVRSSPHGQDGIRPDDDGVQIIADDEQGLTLGDDEIGPEVGRHEQPPMSEHQDSFPWNAYASSKQGSRHGSVRALTSIAGASSSAGRRPGLDFAPSSIGSKQVSRLFAESPLEQRRKLLRHSSILSGSRQGQEDAGIDSADDDFSLDLDISDTALDGRLARNLKDADDFELYGPAAAVSTQQAADPQWLASTLEQEAFNFLSFLRTTVEGKQAVLEHGEDNGDVTVTFEELLPPEDNSEIVAAQGLLHVLSLATKGFITVRQEKDFGSIEVGILTEPTTSGQEVEEEA